MSSLNHQQTPKKMCQSSVPRNLSSCRLCGAVGDRSWSKHLFRKGSRALLAAAEDIYGSTLRQDDNLLPHLVCRPCERRTKNFIAFKTLITESQRSFERVKRCTEISPSVPRTLTKSAKKSEKTRRGLLYYDEFSSAQQQSTAEKEVNHTAFL